uniref:Transthyretin-like protein 5 n=1 Tax=Parascaris univalens TaxID=6257 RepID=A0A915CIV2_PARUN
MTARLVTLILYLLVTGAVAQVPRLCPASCYCETADKISCERAEFETVPTNWPTSIRVLIIKSCSLLRIQKHAFRRYAKLEELIIEGCEHLRSLEKYAFRGLNHLRQSNHLRELSIKGENLHIEANAFTSLTRIDFFNLIGVAHIEPLAFENVSRVHRFEIRGSILSLSEGVLSSMSHVKEIHISDNQIESIETNAFSGLFTIGRLQLRGNSIQNISGHAFSSIVNIGEIIIENNFIAHLHTEALLSSAWRTKFRDNTLRCGCEIVWIQHIKDTLLLKRNFCGPEEYYVSLMNYKPVMCVPQQGGLSSIAFAAVPDSLFLWAPLLLVTLLFRSWQV